MRGTIYGNIISMVWNQNAYALIKISSPRAYLRISIEDAMVYPDRLHPTMHNTDLLMGPCEHGRDTYSGRGQLLNTYGDVAYLVNAV